MIFARKNIAAIVVALAVASSPGFAHENKTGLYMSAARAAAIRECNVKAAKYVLGIWGNFQLYLYRSCMAERHQME